MAKVKEDKRKVKEKREGAKKRLTDILIADKEGQGDCAICGKVIRQGHVYSRLMIDATHSEPRYYHKHTCGPGTENWKAFKANDKRPPEKPPVSPDKVQIKVKRPKAIKSRREVNQLNHRIGTASALIDDLLSQGVSLKGAAKKGIKKERFVAHMKHCQKEHLNIQITEADGVFKAVYK